MHDPSTVAFEIHGPRGLYYRRKREKALQRNDPDWTRIKHVDPIAVIWHVDPEWDGSDDSCGFSYAKLAREEREKASQVAKEMSGKLEGMFGQSSTGKYFALKSSFEMIIGGFEVVAWRIFRKQIKARHLPLVLSAACSPTDNMQSLIKMPIDQIDLERFFMLLARNFKTYDRRWWDSPRLHVHHWKVQLPWLQNLKRWLFSRCAGCRHRFSFGYAPVSNQRNGKGPQWFRSESGVYHHECHGK
jgi:hypothetical protein